MGSTDKIETDETLFANKGTVPPPAGWSGGRADAAGTPSYVDGRPLAAQHSGRPSPMQVPGAQQPQYRAESSASTYGAGVVSYYGGPESSRAPVSAPPVAAPHHRNESSASVLIQTLTELEEKDDYLLSSASSALPPHQAAAPNGATQYAAPANSAQATAQGEIHGDVTQSGAIGPTGQEAQQLAPPGGGAPRRYMASGTSKRVRRKCTVANCPNRVVQGGLCIAHGAKRKQCSYPGCNKNVKKAGLCSTHGPARKKCEHEGCNKVAVQGGVCIAHGARKKLCSVERCTKQAILGGMCKKHHDQHHGLAAPNSNKVGSGARRLSSAGAGAPSSGGGKQPSFCVVVGGGAKVAPAGGSVGQPQPGGSRGTPGHRRGLSLFQEMSAVDTIIGEDGLAEAGVPLAPPPQQPVEGRGEDVPAAAVAAAAGGDQKFSSQELRQQSSGDSMGSITTGPPNRGAESQGEKKRNKGHNRGLSFLMDENVADSIIKNTGII